MSRQTHIKTDTASFASSFLLLVMVSGVLNLDLFASDGVSGYNGHRVRVLVELVLKENDFLQFPVLSICKNIPGSDVVEDRILPFHFYATCFGTASFVIKNTRQANIRPVYSSHNYSSSFNVPHQNSDEDEVFIFPVDVV